MTRAREVCGEYSIVEPMRPVSEEFPNTSTMTVECLTANTPVDAGPKAMTTTLASELSRAADSGR